MSLTSKIFVFAIFTVVGVGIYANTLDAPFYLDDGHNIVENESIRIDRLSPENFAKVIKKSPMPTRPLANISFALNYYVHQLDVRGYHAVNILIHILTGFVLYLFILATLEAPFGALQEGNKVELAFLAALIWFVHPVQTQAVTYIVQRMASMSALFYVLAMYGYARGRMASPGQQRLMWYIMCATAGLLAMAAKEIAITLPLLILLYEWYFFRNCSRGFARRVLPVLLAAGLLLVLYLFFVDNFLIKQITHLYMFRDFSLEERLWTETRVIVFYLSLLFVPLPLRLSFYHDFALSKGLLTPPTTLLAIVCILLILVLAWKTAGRYRLISFGIIWFVVNLLLESTIIPLELVFEHRLYLPSMLLFTFIPFLLAEVVGRKWLRYGVLTGLILVLAAATVMRNNIWAEPLRFLQNSAIHAQGDPRTHYNLGLYYLRHQEYGKAIDSFGSALDLEPDYAEVHRLTGEAYYELGNYDAAYDHFLAALSGYPGNADLYFQMGLVLMAQNKTREALTVFTDVLRLRPHDPEAHYLAGNLLAKSGAIGQAINHYEQALAYTDQNRYNILVNLGTAYAKKGDFKAALNSYLQAYRLNPQDQFLLHNIDRARANIQ